MSLGGAGNAISKVVSFTILGLLFKEKKQKDNIQRIGELSEQTAKEGEPRPIIWGRVRPISGNIMHSSRPKIIVREIEGQSSGGGGKGGKKKEPKQYEERVLRTYAIRICEGPITKIVRVWRNNKLVYDTRGNAWGAQNNGVFLRVARFYLGRWTQMPDPALESVWGAGNVPAYRGTCYMVVPEEDLTELGGAIPQYTFEVERAEGTYLTSKPYAVENIEPAQAGQYRASTPPEIPPDDVRAGLYFISFAELREPLISYDDGEPDRIESGKYFIQSATLRAPLVIYSDGTPDQLAAAQYNALAAELRVALIVYDQWPIETIDAGKYIVIGATLT